MAMSTWLTVAILLQILMFTLILFSYQLDQNVPNHALSLSIPYVIGRAASISLHINLAILLLPVCNSLRWVFHNTIGQVTKLEDETTIQYLAAYSILGFALVHAGGQWAIFAQLSVQQGFGPEGFALLNFATGVGWSGHVMLVVLILIIACTGFHPRNSLYWYTLRFSNCFRGLFFALWAVHEAFCVPNWSLDSFTAGSNAFWKFWVAGAMIYVVERMLLLGLRSTQKAQIIKIVQHPNAVFEIRFEKLLLKPHAGQQILLSFPSVSLTEKKHFPLTSAPEEDFLSIHLRPSDEFPETLAAALCNNKSQKHLSTLINVEPKDPFVSIDPAMCRILPQIYVYGPFGDNSTNIFNSEIAVLVGVEAGVTLFASILKSIWYRMNHPRQKTQLRKVYFFWICHDFESFEWFRSLLMAIELQDIDSQIEIYPYLTAAFDEADATKNMINSTVQGSDIVTGLRSPTRHGEPYWDEIFADISQIHTPNKASVFYSGPLDLGAKIRNECKLASGNSVGGEFSFNFEESDF